MIWAKEETLPREELEEIQLRKLQQTVSYIYERVAPYRGKMDKAGVAPEDIRSLDDKSDIFCQSSHSYFSHTPYFQMLCLPIRILSPVFSLQSILPGLKVL